MCKACGSFEHVGTQLVAGAKKTNPANGRKKVGGVTTNVSTNRYGFTNAPTTTSKGSKSGKLK